MRKRGRAKRQTLTVTLIYEPGFGNHRRAYAYAHVRRFTPVLSYTNYIVMLYVIRSGTTHQVTSYLLCNVSPAIEIVDRAHPLNRFIKYARKV